MDSQISAKLAEGSYILGQARKLGDGYENVNKHVADLGYEVIPQYSNRNITTYRKTDDPTNIHIAHKGTQVSSKTGTKDILSDIKIALGLGNYSTQAIRRKNKSEKIVRELQPETLTMSGHSLAGQTLNYTLAKSKLVRDNLDFAHTFNAGSSPVGDNIGKISDKARKELSNRVIHHRTKDDIVSKGLKLRGVPFGKLQEYKLKATDKEKEHRELHDNLLKKETPKSKEELKKMKWNDKALYAHHLHHFSDRVLDPLIRKSKK
jgi:hypothetical protein